MPVLVVVALLGVPAFGYLGDRLVGDAAAREGKDAEGRAAEAALAERGVVPVAGWPTSRTGISAFVAERPFELRPAHGPLRGGPPRAEARERAIAVLGRELGRYSAGWLAKAGLARVVLSADLTEDGAPIPSLPNYLQTLFVDVGVSEVYLARLVHHEVFHFFDRATRGRITVDPEWDALNAPGFAYGTGGRSMRASWVGEPRRDLTGFVTSYATSAVEEDKAELYSFAMTAGPAIREQAAGDPALQKKLAALAARLAAFGRPPEGLAGSGAAL